MIKQLPITDKKEVVKRILNHQWGKKIGIDWDISSLAHRWWIIYVTRHWNRLKKMQWKDIYKEADKKLN